jgi:hypothetical protein
MLIKINGEDAWTDLVALESTDDVDADESGVGAITAYRGTPGFVCFARPGGKKLVLVNARHVVGLRAAEGGVCVLETARDREIEVQYDPENAVLLLNRARQHVR